MMNLPFNCHTCDSQIEHPFTLRTPIDGDVVSLCLLCADQMASEILRKPTRDYRNSERALRIRAIFEEHARFEMTRPETEKNGVRS